MFGYIYITTNLINNKKYIGQHKSEVFTEDYKGSGNAICKAINKYGIDNFKVELIEECNSLEELNKREYYYTRLYNAVDNPMFYNLREGGNQPGFSEETRKKISENHADISGSENFYYRKGYLLCGSKNPNYGNHFHHTEESKNKISNSNKGLKRSDKTRRKMAENHADFSGKNNPNYGIGRIKYVNDGIRNYCVKVSEVDEYLNIGFKLGRIRRSS